MQISEYTTPINDDEQNPYCKGYSFSPEKASKANDLTFKGFPNWETSSERIQRWKEHWEKFDNDNEIKERIAKEINRSPEIKNIQVKARVRKTKK